LLSSGLLIFSSIALTFLSTQSDVLAFLKGEQPPLAAFAQRTP
jgi:hypothetical protein